MSQPQGPAAQPSSTSPRRVRSGALALNCVVILLMIAELVQLGAAASPGSSTGLQPRDLWASVSSSAASIAEWTTNAVKSELPNLVMAGRCLFRLGDQKAAESGQCLQKDFLGYCVKESVKVQCTGPKEAAVLLLTNPIFYLLFVPSAIFLMGLATLVFRFRDVLDWLIVQCQLWSIQIQYLNKAPGVQFQVFLLLWLEKARRVDMRQRIRYAKSQGLDFSAPARLPHVDNQFNLKKMKMKMKMPEPIIRDLVLIGGGHAHAYVLKNLGMRPIPGVQVTLITRDLMTPYSGMLPGHIAGFYTKEECHIDLLKLGNFAKARIVHTEATGIDRNNKQIMVKGRPPIPYDVLSINIGSSPQSSSVTNNVKEDSVPLTPVKPIDGFSSRWDIILQRAKMAAESSESKRFKLAVVGGGAGGVELALNIHTRLRNEVAKLRANPDMIEVGIVSKSQVLMPAHNPSVQATFKRIAETRGVKLLLGKEASAIDKDGVLCTDGTRYECDECVWCTTAGAQAWLKETGLQLTKDGFIEVQDTLESMNTVDIFAVGDICHIVNHPRPKAGVFAVRGGPPLAENLRNRLAGLPLNPWTPQTNFLGIIGTGNPEQCVASRGQLCIEGGWLWELKDWIDRNWMAGYTTALPEMEADVEEPSAIASAAGKDALAVLAHASMRCGGCGAKVGATVLSNVMKKLKEEAQVEAKDNGVLIGLDSPDDCAVVAADPHGRASVHTVDFFRSFIKDPYLFGKIAANHALSDCHAMCADAKTALAIAVVPFGMENKVEDTLFQMMSGALSVLKDSNCSLVGGHTCEGSELALGFVVNGLVAPERALRKGGMKEGDAIILTKGVGTGTVLAADMRGKAKGAWLPDTLTSMCQSNKEAALVLQKYGATSCTDVTGFGLLGHLVEMAQASEARVTVSLQDIPTLEGAQQCVDAGIFSSLQPANIRLKRAVENEAEALKHPKYPLLFDPQTAGGLLATVPKSEAEKCVAALQVAGYEKTKVIGAVDVVGQFARGSVVCEVGGKEVTALKNKGEEVL